MITLTNRGVFLTEQGDVIQDDSQYDKGEGIKNTIAYSILKTHNQSDDMESLKLKFDSLVSPDNNYVSILQTAGASGIKEFSIPYVLSNCHNTLCAVGGTINEDDHVFGLDNAKKYGGIFLPPYSAVLHQYMREMMAGGGKMILGSDSHTRYGVLGTLGMGEGGGEVAKQLLGRTYDLKRPPIIAVKLTGKPRPGVGPQDVALALIGATFEDGFSKNNILEFIGPGIANLSVEYRIGIDVMTTESGALSSIWCTDDKVRNYLKIHGREEEYKEMTPKNDAYYDGLIEINLSTVECMIALPFHPSNVVSIRQFKEHMAEIIAGIEAEGQKIKGDKGEAFSIKNKIRNGEFWIDQALVSGCSGGLFENIAAMADVLRGYVIPSNGLSLGINPASLPIMLDLMNHGIAGDLTISGATLRPAICGPCFGVTDVPANNQLSIRHTTRNYPNREGSKPNDGQMAAVMLMDARSIASTARNGGKLTAATELEVDYTEPVYHFNSYIYKNQVFDNYGKGNPDEILRRGLNIADWPDTYPLTRHLLLKVVGVYEGAVTTDDLIPSGEASSFRSNPHKISDYMMRIRDKDYVGRAKAIRQMEEDRRFRNDVTKDKELNEIISSLTQREDCSIEDITIGSVISSKEIGDGSSREQAASCQKVLGGFANIANEYATKRYRSNLINWGILPFLTEQKIDLKVGDYIFVKDVREFIKMGKEEVSLEVVGSNTCVITCTLGDLTEDEKNTLLAGSLINYYK